MEKENIVLTQRLADADQTQKQLKEKVEQLIKEKDALRKEQRSVSQGSSNNESSSERADEAKIRSLNNKVSELRHNKLFNLSCNPEIDFCTCATMLS